MKTERHPCFSDSACHSYGRIHLPVAKNCNVACIYCNRAFDCLNESRPGVTSRILSPLEACEWLEKALSRIPNLSVVGIAGPGDPLANPQATLETFALVKKRHPELLCCLSTNGLSLPQFCTDLHDCGVSHVTVTVNAVDPEIGKHLYHWVENGDTRYTGSAAAKLIFERQKEGVMRLRKYGIFVKINTVLLQENLDHAPQIAREVALWGANRMNCIPFIPVAGTKKALAKPLSSFEVEQVRMSCEEFLPQMRSCARCRADAVGLISNSKPLETVVGQ